MLSQITLKNFYSIKEEAVIDMAAQNIRAFRNADTQSNIFTEDSTPLLKSIAIFGANASGKTNLLKAIEVCLRYIRESHNYTELTTTQFQPFKFHEEAKPSVFEMEFVIGGEKYEYGFSILGKKVVEEHLYSYPKKYRSLVFKRNANHGEEPEYSFSKKFVRPKEVITNTSPYTLFLTRAAMMNRTEATRIFNFVTDRIVLGLPEFDDSEFENLLQRNKKDILSALKYADSDIVDYELRETPDGRNRLVTYHKSNPTKPFIFDSEESAGTRRLLRLLTAFIDVAENGKVLLIDELETSLHPQLVKYAVKIFNKSEKAQLIFSTHDLDLLNIEILRPDQIYFACKDYESGATEVYSLADFTDYKNFKNLRRDYEQGRFDALPFLPTV